MKRKEDKKKVTKMNPYTRSTRKEAATTTEASKEMKRQEGDLVTPIKSNKTNDGQTKHKEQEAKEVELEINSEDESVTTIQQSNTKPNPMQTSPKRDLRHASEGIQLQSFGVPYQGNIYFGMT
jgi:hypothetical protein